MAEELDDHEWLAILRILDRYPHVVDAGEWADLALVFAPDAVCDLRAVGLPRTESLRGLMDCFAETRHPLAHHCLNPVVEDIDDSTVTVRSKFLVTLADRSAFGGDYVDVLARRPEGWRIVDRTVVARQEGATWPLTFG